MAERDKSSDEAGKESGVASGGSAGGRRFRLPKLFADSDEAAGATADAPAADAPTADAAAQARASAGAVSGNIAGRAGALGVPLPTVADPEIIATANRPFAGEPRAAVLREPAGSPAAPPAAPPPPRQRAAIEQVAQPHIPPTVDAQPDPAPDALLPTSPGDGVELAPASVAIDAASVETAPITAAPAASAPVADVSTFAPLPDTSAPSQPATRQSYGEFGYIEQICEGPGSEEQSAGSGTQLLQEIAALRGGMEEMYRTLQEMAEHGQTQDKVFNALHAELQDYKNDFIYEHLKPVVRPLLFLYDSLEQFDSEMRQHERVGPMKGGAACRRCWCART